MIDIDKKYITRNGLAVEIFKVIPEDQPYPQAFRVLGAVIQVNGIYDLNRWLLNGRFREEDEYYLDLVEVTPYDDFKVDDKVICWSHSDQERKMRRYFAGVNEDGEPTAFPDGTTSWSSNGSQPRPWGNCVKYEE